MEAWLAKHGKTPSRYRHMMCFGAHGVGHAGHGSRGNSCHGNAGNENRSYGHVDGSRSSTGQRLEDNISCSSRADDVACSLFMVAVQSNIHTHAHTHILTHTHTHTQPFYFTALLDSVGTIRVSKHQKSKTRNQF